MDLGIKIQVRPPPQRCHFRLSSTMSSQSADLYAVAGMYTVVDIHSSQISFSSRLLSHSNGHRGNFGTTTADSSYTTCAYDIQVAKYIAECQRILEKSGLKYKVPFCPNNCCDGNINPYPDAVSVPSTRTFTRKLTSTMSQWIRNKLG